MRFKKRWPFALGQEEHASLCMSLREATYSAKDTNPSCLSALERKWQQRDKIVTLSQKSFSIAMNFLTKTVKHLHTCEKNRCLRNLPEEGPKHYLLTIAKTDDSVRCVGFFFFFPNNNFWERAFTVVSVSEQNLSHVCPSSSPSLHGEEAVWLRSYLVGDTNVFQSTFCHHDCLITRFSVLNLLTTQHALRFISYFIIVIIIFVWQRHLFIKPPS